MSLRSTLRQFSIEAFDHLLAERELPRPPGDVPIIADNVFLTHRLSQMPAYVALMDYMRSSGLAENLQGVGHTWMWNEEVFHWLFIERLIATTRGNRFDPASFDLLFGRAQRELSRRSFRFRRLTVLDAVASPTSPVALGAGLRLAPLSFKTAHYELGSLLGIRDQDANRFPQTVIFTDGPVLIQDRIVSKGGDGNELLRVEDELDLEASNAILSLRLTVGTPVYPKHTYSAYLSGFPLLPVSHHVTPEFEMVSWGIKSKLTRGEIGDLKEKVKWVAGALSGKSTEPSLLITSLRQFSNSVRVRNQTQSIIDLVMVLEGLVGSQSGELLRTLARNAALLLGADGRRSEEIYQFLKAMYNLRNTLVHGRRTPKEDVQKELRRLLPKLKADPPGNFESHVPYAEADLRAIVRALIRAFIYMRTRGTRNEWPTENDLDEAIFSSDRRRLLRRQLGLNAARESRSVLTHWPRFQ